MKGRSHSIGENQFSQRATYVASTNVAIGFLGVLCLAFATRLLPTVSDLGFFSIIALVLALLQAIVTLDLSSIVARFLPEINRY